MPFRNIMPPPPKPYPKDEPEMSEPYGERITIDGMRVPEMKGYQVGDEITIEGKVTVKEIEERQDKKKHRLEYRIEFKEVAIPVKKKKAMKEEGPMMQYGVPQ